MSAPTHAERALWADEALQAFIARTRCYCEESLADLLCDLMHWSDRAALSFERELGRARYHYAAELAGAKGRAA